MRETRSRTIDEDRGKLLTGRIEDKGEKKKEKGMQWERQEEKGVQTRGETAERKKRRRKKEEKEVQ